MYLCYRPAMQVESRTDYIETPDFGLVVLSYNLMHDSVRWSNNTSLRGNDLRDGYPFLL